MPSRKVYVPSATAEADAARPPLGVCRLRDVFVALVCESEGWRVALMPSTNDGLDGLTLVLRGALRVHAGGDASGPGTWPDARGFAILRVSDGAIVSADTPQGERPPVDGLALLIERSRPRSVVGPSLTNYTGGACRDGMHPMCPGEWPAKYGPKDHRGTLCACTCHDHEGADRRPNA